MEGVCVLFQREKWLTAQLAVSSIPIGSHAPRPHQGGRRVPHGRRDRSPRLVGTAMAPASAPPPQPTRVPTILCLLAAGFHRWLRVEPATGGAALLSDRRRRQGQGPRVQFPQTDEAEFVKGDSAVDNEMIPGSRKP
uniref:Uncharacterized protein n=1 Tax=Oryza meridionalis TaxID=40149 RepID=A0A0E0CIH2_9ORYZ